MRKILVASALLLVPAACGKKSSNNQSPAPAAPTQPTQKPAAAPNGAAKPGAAPAPQSPAPTAPAPKAPTPASPAPAAPAPAAPTPASPSTPTAATLPSLDSMTVLTLGQDQEFDGQLTTMAGLKAPAAYGLAKYFKLVLTQATNVAVSSDSTSTYACTDQNDTFANGFVLMDQKGNVLQKAGDALGGSGVEDDFTFGGQLAAGTYVIQVILADSEACSGSVDVTFSAQ